jgi:uncharacterized alkaline shock family protein YloU
MSEVHLAQQTPAGEVRISQRALAQIVRRALAELGGDAQIADVGGALELLRGSAGLEVDLSISVRAGAPIARVAEQAGQIVGARLSQATGMEIVRLQIYLHDTRPG